MEHCHTTKRCGALSLLLAAIAASGSGCSVPLHHLPDECAAAVYECNVARLIDNVCRCEPLIDCASGIECDSTVPCECANVDETLYERRRVEVGPPPATYKPPMPPKFLPVPSRPVFSPANGSPQAELASPLAPRPVEVDFDGQLTFPGLE